MTNNPFIRKPVTIDEDSIDNDSADFKALMDFGFEDKEFVDSDDLTVPSHYYHRTQTGLPCMDTLFGGIGILPGLTATLSAAPGCGKTTLMLQLMDAINKNTDGKLNVGYASGEEDKFQLKYTLDRLGCRVKLANMTDIDHLRAAQEHLDFLVIDAFQCLTTDKVRGEKAKEQYAVKTLVKGAQETKCTTFFIMHRTKDGKMKGGTLVPHAVGMCMDIFVGDPEVYNTHNARIVAVRKNRFGPLGAVCLRLTGKGYDFADPIEQEGLGEAEDNKASAARGKAKQDQKSKELDSIIESIKQKGSIRLPDICPSIVGDTSRAERLIKELEKQDRIVKLGRGQAARWELGTQVV